MVVLPQPPKRKTKTPILKLKYLEKTLYSFLANTVLSILFCSYQAVFYNFLLIYFSHFFLIFKQQSEAKLNVFRASDLWD